MSLIKNLDDYLIGAAKRPGVHSTGQRGRGGDGGDRRVVARAVVTKSDYLR